MSAAAPEVLTPDMLAAIVNEVATAMLGEEAMPLPEGTVAGASGGQLTATVAIRGPWDGLVAVSCPREGAELLWRDVVRADSGEGADAADVDDAVKELANIVGGNIKALLPGTSSLGLPQVAGVPAGATPVCEIEVLALRTPMAISIWTV